jgi:hypothetical protein
MKVKKKNNLNSKIVMREGVLILEINKIMVFILFVKIQNKAWKMIVLTIFNRELKNYRKI